MKIQVFIFLGLLMWVRVEAQVSVRKEDHFYKRLVVQRMDLDEKINRPFRGVLRHPSDQGGANGLVQTLLSALEEGAIKAYDPDDLSRAMSYEEVVRRMKSFEQALRGSPILDDYAYLPDSLETDDSDILNLDADMEEENKDLGPYESVVQWTEDWIFDKNRGVMVKQIRHIQLIWTDPGETLPEKYLAVFEYGEAREVLEEARWHNRFNDAEHRSLKEAFDLRLFHSYIINVSGNGVRELAEAEKRRLQLVEFEHHLWSY